MKRVVIVGAGISGLALGYRLQASVPEAEITILESNARVGGKIWTSRRDGFQVEEGPNGFLESKPSTMQLCRDVGIGPELIAASESSRKNRYLFLNERLHKLPGGPLGLLTTRLLSPRGKLDLLGELARQGAPPAHDESVTDFFGRRLGREAAEVLGDALVTGIHGGDPALLSLKSAFPRAAEMEVKHGSVIRGFLRSAKQRRRDAMARGEPPPKTGRMWSFAGGLRRLVEALGEQLGRTLHAGVNVRRIEPVKTAAVPAWLVRGDGQECWSADALVLASPAYEQAAMLGDAAPELAQLLGEIPYNRIAVVAVGFRTSDVPRIPDGFGFIAPQRTRRDILGVQWCSAIYPGRAPDGCVLWRALCGGWNRPDVVDWSDDQLLAAVRRELQLAQGVGAAPVFHHIVRWPRAIPQYQVGHFDRLLRIEAGAKRYPGLFLAGNSLHGVALNDCTEQADLVAQRVAEFLAATAGKS